LLTLLKKIKNIFLLIYSINEVNKLKKDKYIKCVCKKII